MIRRILISTFIAGFIFFVALFARFSYPSNFESQQVFLAPGTFPRQISEQLEESNVVYSSFTLHVILKLRGKGGALVPGDYLFDKKQSVFRVASRITSGDFQMVQKIITIPEGSTNEQIADIIDKVFPGFDKQPFIAEAYGRQGYLFPDTYHLLSTSSVEIISTLRDNFDYQVRDLQAEAIGEGKSWDNIVTLASILEEEANTDEDNRLVAGILWNRLKIGMALQVDAEPSTYKVPGLPSRAISNPGLQTLDAALHPTESDYLYYLTGRDGMMHYAETYEQHQRNIETHLR